MIDIDRYNLPRSSWDALIDQWIIGQNAERDREILRRRLLDGVRYESLAEEFDLSVQRVKSIVYRARNRLFMHV